MCTSYRSVRSRDLRLPIRNIPPALGSPSGAANNDLEIRSTGPLKSPLILRPPAMLSVCKKSRDMVLKNYEKRWVRNQSLNQLFNRKNAFVEFYIDPNWDMVLSRSINCLDYFETNSLWGRTIRGNPHLIVDPTRYTVFNGDKQPVFRCSNLPGHSSFLSYFGEFFPTSQIWSV